LDTYLFARAASIAQGAVRGSPHAGGRDQR